MSEPQAPDRPGNKRSLACLVAFSVPAAAVLLVILLVALPWFDRFSENARQIEGQVDRLSRLQAIAASRPDLEKAIGQARKDLKDDEWFLPGATSAVAAADLQNRVKTAVDAAGGELVSTQVLPLKQVGNLTQIGVRVQLRGATDSLINVLYDLETGTPVLELTNMTLHSTVVPQRGRRANVGEDGVPSPLHNLRTNVDIFGYRKGEDS